MIKNLKRRAEDASIDHIIGGISVGVIAFVLLLINPTMILMLMICLPLFIGMIYTTKHVLDWLNKTYDGDEK